MLQKKKTKHECCTNHNRVPKKRNIGTRLLTHVKDNKSVKKNTNITIMCMNELRLHLKKII